MTHEEPRRRKVLLVEDDGQIAADITEILADPRIGSYDVVVAASVKSAIQKARNLIRDLHAAVLEHCLPDGDGADVYAEFQNLSPAFAERRVAVWSSDSPDNIRNAYGRLHLRVPPVLKKYLDELLEWLRSLEDVTCDEGKRGEEELNAAIRWLEDEGLRSDLEELDE